MKKKNEIILKKEMTQHIRGHNNKLSEEYLMELTIPQLYCEIHPNYKEWFEKREKELNPKNKE